MRALHVPMVQTVESTHGLVTPDQLAGLLQVSKRSLWRLRSSGKLPRPVKLGGSVRWRAEEVRLWIEAGCPNLREWDTIRRSLGDPEERTDLGSRRRV